MMRVTILDMQPIDPPVGGGRLRLLGLYHALGEGLEATYVGSYDWPGEAFRDQQITPGLREIMVPLSKEHFRAVDAVSREVGGKTVIDSVFHRQVDLSPDYLDAVRKALETADVVVYSHPWLYPPTAKWLDRERQLIVYDAHNVEGKLRTSLLDDGGVGTQIAREVVEIERELSITADLMLTCSHEDGQAFSRLYGTDPAKIRVVPNGAFTEKRPAADSARRRAAKAALDLPPHPVAIFIGSAYTPNVEAARFIIDHVAPINQSITFVISGGVGDALSQLSGQNVIVTGQLTEAEKETWFDSADLALNPMFSGSGTNIKMLDFMAAGLPILTTPTGARGIETSEPAFRTVSRGEFSRKVADLWLDISLRDNLSSAARSQVRRFYSWERLSANLGSILQNHHARLNRRPKFSVIIPTYERHELLLTVLERLSVQDFRDFEVVVVDQSAQPLSYETRVYDIPVSYIHTDIRGAVTARNVGAQIATGEILAFTDDDCEPSAGWLSGAAARFAEENIVGLEGLIVSDKLDDPNYRPVTNDGFEGIGFMTANLFIRSDIFQSLGGFDIRFENPHFREDTDLGWRAQRYGQIPFSREAWLFHPPHRRSIERESLSERSRFFIKDALLMAKHPERYTALFFAEQQWRHNPYFLHYFAEGLAIEGVEPPPDLKRRMKEAGLTLPKAFFTAN